MQLPKPLFLKQARRPYTRAHLVKDAMSGHLVRRAVNNVFTFTSAYARDCFSREGMHETGDYSAMPSLQKGDGLAEMREAFDAASWSNGGTEACARWGVNGGSGRYYGQWYAYVIASGFRKTFSVPYSCLSHIAGVSFACRRYEYVKSLGAGEARVAIQVADSASNLPVSLASLQSLPYVVIHGTGQYAFSDLHVASAGKMIFLIAYIAGLEPPDSDCYQWDWDISGYPNASFSIFDRYGGCNVVVTYETEQDALSALSGEE